MTILPSGARAPWRRLERLKRLKRYSGALVALFVCAQVLAQAVPDAGANAAQAAVPLEHFFQRPSVLEAKLSPSGLRVAVTTSRGVNRVGLVVLELQPALSAAASAPRGSPARATTATRSGTPRRTSFRS